MLLMNGISGVVDTCFPRVLTSFSLTSFFVLISQAVTGKTNYLDNHHAHIWSMMTRKLFWALTTSREQTMEAKKGK